MNQDQETNQKLRSMQEELRVVKEKNGRLQQALQDQDRQSIKNQEHMFKLQTQVKELKSMLEMKRRSAQNTTLNDSSSQDPKVFEYTSVP